MVRTLYFDRASQNLLRTEFRAPWFIPRGSFFCGRIIFDDMTNAPQVTITRRMMFNAAHRVHNPALSDAENTALFGKCNNPNWHGHNYTLDVSVTGSIDDKTGYVIDLSQVKAIVQREIIEKVDHRNFNLEVDFMRGIIPTTENIVVAMWRVLAPAMAPAKLTKLVLWETQNNYVEYSGQ